MPPSPNDSITLNRRHTQLRQAIEPFASADFLARRIREWIGPDDRHLPAKLLDNTLKQVLDPWAWEMFQVTPGIGLTKLGKLLDLVVRAQNELTNGSAAPIVTPAFSDDPGPFRLSPHEVTPEIWAGWCRAVRAHRLEHESLGRFATSLADLPQPLWTTPLSMYLDRPLCDLWTLPGYGEARVGQVFDVFARIARTAPTTDPPLAIHILPRAAREAAAWAERVLRDGRVPDAPAVRDGFLRPLFALLDTDLGPEAAGMVRRRLGLDGPAETLDQVGADAGLTRERVRQITARAATVVRARWPEGRYLLNDVYALVQAAGATEPLALLGGALEACFGLDLPAGCSRADVLREWGLAGRAKRTPMTRAEVHGWAAETFPAMPAELACRWLEEDGLSDHRPDAEPRFFAADPLDALLRRLLAGPDPLSVADLPAALGQDERNARLRIERDARFVEDEFKRIYPAERCSFVRTAGRWGLQLDPVPGVTPRQPTVDVPELAHLIVGGLLQLGVADATVWGVHRFAATAVRRVYGGTFAAAITPFVLASALTRQSDGLVRTMRRRRLRWDTADGSPPVRGKRGWVDHVATTAGVPLTFDELDAALRDRYQDYEPYVLKQLHLTDDEDGDAGAGCQYVPGVSHVIPGVLVPRGWALDPAAVNVSAGVRQVAEKVIAMNRRSPFPLTHLWNLPWMVPLCEHLARGPVRWRSAAEPEPQEVEPTDSMAELGEAAG